MRACACVRVRARACVRVDVAAGGRDALVGGWAWAAGGWVHSAEQPRSEPQRTNKANCAHRRSIAILLQTFKSVDEHSAFLAVRAYTKLKVKEPVNQGLPRHR